MMTLKGKHLDFACGPGTFIGNYLSLDSIGVDISVKQINFAVISEQSCYQYIKQNTINKHKNVNFYYLSLT